MTSRFARIVFGVAIACVSASASAALQPGTPDATVIAIPPMTTPDSGTKGNEMLAIAWQATQLIETDLRQTSELMALPSDRDFTNPVMSALAPLSRHLRKVGAVTSG